MRRKKQIWFFALLSLLILAFIFSNSLQTAEASAHRSSGLAAELKAFFDPAGKLTVDEFHHYVRKAAHFSEFAALGFSLMGFFDAAAKRKNRAAVFAFVCGVTSAGLDEGLQFFSDGRAPGIADVGIDSAGVFFGLLCMLLLLRLLRKRRPAVSVK